MYSPILEEEIAEGAPLDVLTLTKIKDNLDYLKAQSGSGGGGAMEWSVDMANGASEDIGSDSLNVLSFIKGNKAKLIVQVPAGFEAGALPKLLLGYYNLSGNGSEFVTFATNIKVLRGNTPIDAPLDQATLDTNIVMSLDHNSPANVAIELGTVGGVVGAAVLQADDFLIITLERKESDTFEDNIFVIPSLTSVNFTE